MDFDKLGTALLWTLAAIGVGTIGLLVYIKIMLVL